jgi:hypothetical protein
LGSFGLIKQEIALKDKEVRKQIHKKCNNTGSAEENK